MFEKAIIIFVVCCVFSLSFAEESTDLNRLAGECIEAEKKYKTIQKDFFFKVLHTVEYKGWSGDAHNFELKFPIAMTLQYAGAEKKGYYWFQNNPGKKYHITVKSDSSGNLELVHTIRHELSNYTFRGLMNNGVIKGLWEKGDGKKSFAFYATIEK